MYCWNHVKGRVTNLYEIIKTRNNVMTQQLVTNIKSAVTAIELE